MSEPLISVIMAAYNAERFIDEAVSSICSQTIQDWELIVVDDCSTDSTYKRLLELSSSDQRIKLHKTEHNAGIGGARDFGLKYAKGKYIAFMDSDDIAFPDRLRKQAEYFKEHPDVIGLGTQTIQVNENGEEIGRKSFPLEPAILSEMLYTAAPIQIPTLMVNRTKLPTPFNWFENVRYAEDTLLFFKLLQHGSLANLPDCLQFYRYYSDSISANFSKKIFFGTWRARGIGRRKYGYRASLKSRLISGLQFIIISCLPNVWIHPFYRRTRKFMLMLTGHSGEK